MKVQGRDWVQIVCLTEPVLTTFLLCSWVVLPVKVEVIMAARCCKRMERVGKVAGPGHQNIWF